MTEREQFEAWVRSSTVEVPHRDKHGFYDEPVCEWWKVWQAARAQPAQPGAEPAPSAVVCGRCDGTGLDARYCNYQCEKCDGSGQAGAEPVAWTHDCAALLTNDVELWIDACPHCGKPRTSPHLIKQMREPSTDGVLIAVEESIRNGGCPWQIEQAFDEYEAERRNSTKEGA